jgi:hypothetical protein
MAGTTEHTRRRTTLLIETLLIETLDTANSPAYFQFISRGDPSPLLHAVSGHVEHTST